MRRTAIILACCMLPATPAGASDCPGNPEAIGTSRTLVVDPQDHARIGSFQYPETLPLAEKEIVLTLDDAPRPPFTAQVLDILARECVKATYFVIGRHAREFPDLLRRIRAEGHTVAVHSENHPLSFPRLSPDRLRREVEGSMATIAGVLGDEQAVAPFFRIPGLLRSDAVDRHINATGMMVWSTDVMAHDWARRITEAGIIRRSLDRLAEKGHRGILLLHDIKEKTAAALPELLRELKARGYRIVHVVPAGPDRPATSTQPEQWVFRPQDQRPLSTLLLADIARLDQAMADYRRLSRVDSCGEAWSAARRPTRIRQAVARKRAHMVRRSAAVAIPAVSPAP